MLLSSTTTGQAAQSVTLLKHPYPYRASLTILSDLHRTTIAEFEAVHHLINDTEVLTPASEAWRVLGFDQWAPAEGRTSIKGFGFPFSDTFFFYDSVFGWFSDYDDDNDEFGSSDDLDSRFAEWYRRGYIGAIHSFGPGEITRAKSIAATDYLLETISRVRPIRVWVDHSKSVTPSGVGGVCCTLLNQTLVDLRYRVFTAMGIGSSLSEPDNLPGSLRRVGYLGLVVGVLLAVVAIAGLTIGRPKIRNLCLFVSVLALGIGLSLQLTKVDFYQGDNPESVYYNLDHVRRLGIRYYWTVSTDYWKSTVSGVSLPEHVAATGRPSIFKTHSFDDGSRGLMFMRNTIDGRARTLSLLSAENLNRLSTVGGRAILYLHWLTNPKSYFNSDGIRLLEQLADRRESIWITSAESLLDQAYAYSYLDYSVTSERREVSIDISGFEDPVEGPVDAALDMLQNLSFRCHNCSGVVLSLRGRALDSASVSVVHEDGDLIASIRSAPQ